MAKAVFDKVTHSGCLDAPNIRYLQSPYAVFNGDLMLAAFKPSGGMHVLLGDFTGHGLPAAIGAMPLAEVFYGMTAKGYSLAEVLREINAKLKRILPVGVFCCATLLNISFQRQVVEVWSGGLPDGYLLRSDGERLPLVIDPLIDGSTWVQSVATRQMLSNVEYSDNFSWTELDWFWLENSLALGAHKAELVVHSAKSALRDVICLGRTLSQQAVKFGWIGEQLLGTKTNRIQGCHHSICHRGLQGAIALALKRSCKAFDALAS